MSINPEAQIRRKILDYSNRTNEGHVASSFSIVEMLHAIYLVDEENTNKHSNLNQRLIISKGHAAFALYAFYSHFNLLDFDEDKICVNGSKLIGHVPYDPEFGFTFGSGSLGHGFPYAIGRAYRNLKNGISDQIYCIVGDGELNEGSCYEAFLMLKKFPRLPINILIDNNKSAERGLAIDMFLDSIRAFWGAHEIDGHCTKDIFKLLTTETELGYRIIICNTIKGYPIAEMINNPAWHHRSPTLTETEDFKKLLG